MKKVWESTRILSISIEGLFGYNNIDIDMHKNNNLVILYGDNGSGKTTILNLINHIFSPEPRSGHRSFIGDITFKFIKIDLSNDLLILISRENSDDGPYRIIIKKGKRKCIDWLWTPREDGRNRENENENEYVKYCSLMKELNLRIFYLPANRRTDNANADERHIIREYPDGEETIVRRFIRSKNNTVSLERSLDKFQQWIRHQMINRTNLGYKSINDLYYDIIKRLVENKEVETIKKSKENIIKYIEEIDHKNTQYKKFGLSGDFLKDDFVEMMKSMDNSNIGTIDTILNPYLDSINLRLKSLEGLQILLSKFEDHLNGFFTSKTVKISIENGVIIESKTKMKLNPTNLSSGEKQILLMFCDVIAARNYSQLIIIDEPEISLNVKWQRIFLSSLLDIIDKDHTQLFIATHSIEMITKFKENVRPLEVR
jgi:energy-coupling factor transporter ATP-binding protein EcfA2